MSVNGNRLHALETIDLSTGMHASINEGACIMEAVAYIAGETWSDRPQCASMVIGDFLRLWNDAMDDQDRQMLKPLIPRLVGTAGSAEVELRRAYLALNWHCRVSAPAWLRLAGLATEAAAIEATSPITGGASVAAVQTSLDAAKQAAYAAGAAARAAAGDAAWAAARDAAWARLRPTVEAMQASALSLVEQMIAVRDEVAR